MDVHVVRRGQPFVWDSDKAAINLSKHGVSFDQACDVFFDFLLQYVDASVPGERREAAIGQDATSKILFVVHLQYEDDCIRLISARTASSSERKIYENHA
jgi:uncharacterized DUF497 family protein